jgi:hypothetical protein
VSNKPTVCKLQEADDTNATSFADITAFATPTIPNANTAATAVLQNNYKFNVDCRARKRYLQPVYSPQTTQWSPSSPTSAAASRRPARPPRPTR